MATSTRSAGSARIMHTMVRVGDLKRSIDFYSKYFGMDVIRTIDVPEGNYTNVFIGYGEEKTDPMIELTYNYGVSNYEKGNGFGHLAVGVKDIYATCETMRHDGVAIIREPGPVKFGTTVIAFVDDPDGYRIELIQDSK